MRPVCDALSLSNLGNIYRGGARGGDWREGSGVWVLLVIFW